MIDYILIKLASRCNFDCSYCYWFRDSSVRKLPALMSEEVITAFLAALEKHLVSNGIHNFVCSFHGGEPTLFGAARLKLFLQRLDVVGVNTDCSIRYALTTNGSLIDRQWVDLVKEFAISVAVSIDGPPDIHDNRRRTVSGAPTWRETVNGYFSLCRAGIFPSIIAVCDPLSDAVAVLDHLAKDLGVRFCDVLVPDCNHTDIAQSIAPYYIKLFDHWYDNYMDVGVEVRILSDFVRGLLGLPPQSDSIGLAPVQTVCLSPTGKLEPLDVLRIAGKACVDTECNILSSSIEAVEQDPLWRSIRDASLNLCATCNSCRYRVACGGGHLAQRWSPLRAYDNPSVYCSDYMRIFDHIADRLKVDIDVAVSGATVRPDAIFQAIASGRPQMMLSA